VKASDEALSVVEGAQGIKTALEADVEVEVRSLVYSLVYSLGCLLLQQGQREIVARAHCEQLIALIARVSQYAGQF
jgi:hypothetical protein